jgi:hypothetical protein
LDPFYEIIVYFNLLPIIGMVHMVKPCQTLPKESAHAKTVPNFIERKHPRKGEKKKQGSRTKVQASKTAQKRQTTRRKWNHYISKAKSSTNLMKHIN